MQVHVVVAPVFATNSCIVVEETTGDAVIVDAGAGVAETIAELVDKGKWTVRAVLATHGHVDHTWDAGKLCEKYGVPMRIHADDAYRLSDPFGTLGAGSGRLVSAAFEEAARAVHISPNDFVTPPNIQTFTATGDDGNGNLIAGGIKLGLIHAPGHTEGSTLYLTAKPTLSAPDIDGLVLSGDVIFAGSVGRTDLPGGDQATMEKSLVMLREKLDPKFGIIPGHGPTSTVGYELATNPYLQG